LLIEASTPLTIRRRSGDVRLLPGQPIDFPEDEALKLLARAPGKVREAITDWLAAWRELAALTSGLTVDDPRLPIVMAALNTCDDAYLSGDWVAFRQAAARVRSAIEGSRLRAEP
jgi:hypothetical protein